MKIPQHIAVRASLTIMSVVCGIVLPMSASAATATSSTQLPVANVYIHNATIVNETPNSFTVFFYIGNGLGAQADVKYGVELFKAGPHGSQVLADQYIANDTLSLTSGEAMVGHQLTYTAPAFFSGAYQVWITAENSSGFPYSAVPAGTVTFTPSVHGYANILAPTCFLSVLGDTTHTQYTPQQGVDILPTESLVATCQVSNQFPSQEVVLPQFETRYRSQYGAVVSVPMVPVATTTLVAGKTQTFAFALPIAQTPQAYDVKMTFVNESGAVVSNGVIFHYVVAGPSGTIQNATLDKNWYAMGDTAHATVFWTPSADSFPGSRYGSTATGTLQVEASLSAASSSVLCGAPVTVQVPAMGSSTVISIPLIATCANPSLLVSLKDANGNLLDQKTFTVMSPPGTSYNKPLLLALGTIVAALVLYGIIDVIYLRRKTHPLV